MKRMDGQEKRTRSLSAAPLLGAATNGGALGSALLDHLGDRKSVV